MKTLLTAAAWILSLYCFAQEPKLILPIGHTSDIHSASISSDGKKIVTASMDNTAKIWDVVTGRLLLSLNGHKNWVFSAYFSKDAKKIITSSIDSTIKIWDAGTGMLLKSIVDPSYFLSEAMFSPDESFILSCSFGKVKVWDAVTGDLRYTFIGFKDVVTKLEFSPDGITVIATDVDGTLQMFRLHESRKILSLPYGYSARFTANGRTLLVPSTGNKVVLYDVKTGKQTGTVQFNQAVWWPCLYPDGKSLFVVYDSTAVTWDTVLHKELVVLKGHSQSITQVFFSKDGKYIITDSRDDTIKVWQTATGKLLYNITGQTAGILSVEFSAGTGKLITASKDRTVKIWDISSGKVLTVIKGHANSIEEARFSPDGRSIITSNKNNTLLQYWDANQMRMSFPVLYYNTKKIDNLEFSADGRFTAISAGQDVLLMNRDYIGQFKTLSNHSNDIKAIRFSYDSKKLVTASYDKTATIWDTESGFFLKRLAGHANWINVSNFSPDNKRIVTAGGDDTAKVWEAETGRILFKLTGHPYTVEYAAFSPDGKKIVSSSSADRAPAKLWDATNGHLLVDLPGHERQVYYIQFSPDSKTFLTSSWDPVSKLWETATGKLLMTMPSHIYWETKSNLYSPDGSKVVMATADFGVDVWDIVNKEKILQLKGHSLLVTSAEFSPNGKYILTASKDFTSRIWNAVTGEEILMFVSLDSTESLVKLPSGYYQCTPAAAKQLHYVTKDQKIISFDQLDVKYNRPDKILEAIGNTDTAFINSFKRAYYKRIKKLGIDTAQFRDGYSVPEADIVNREQISYQQKKEILKLKIHAADSIYRLDRLNIWINEVPLFGLKGISIKERRSKVYDTTIAVHLSQGENRIETSVTNVNGTESYHMPLYVNYSPAQPVKETVYFIGIGINEFADSAHNLRWCVKDISNLALKLKEKYPAIIIDTLFNRNVTVSNVRKLKQQLLKTTVNDKVIIAYSGHGMLSKQYDYFLSAYNVNFSQPEENGIAYEEIENLLDGIAARKKLLLLDACHSGELDKDELLAIQDNQRKTGNRGVLVNRGSNEEETGRTKTVGLQNSFELMQSLFVNVGKGTGAVVIAAAGGVQFAQERGDLQNGVFSFALLEAMEQYKTMTVSQLKTYVEKRVEDMTKGHQRPTTRNELKETDWMLW